MLKVGQIVLHKRFKKTGTIVEVKGQKITLLIGSMSCNCSPADIESIAEPKQKIKSASKVAVRSKANSKNIPDQLDLHGLTVAEAQSALEQYFSDVILADKRSVDIIHGHGTGRLQSAVNKFLSSAEYVGRFEKLQFNSGTTRVYLKKIAS